MATIPIGDLQDCHAQDRYREKGYGADEYPCILCGKPVKDGSTTARWVHVHNGGMDIITEDEDMDALGGPAADLGMQPIGPECYRRNRDRLRPFVLGGQQ